LYLSSHDKEGKRRRGVPYGIHECVGLQVPKSIGRFGYIYVAICTYTHMRISCKVFEENRYYLVLSMSLAGVDVWKAREGMMMMMMNDNLGWGVREYGYGI